MTGRLVQGLDHIPAEARGGVLTIGNFDGVHVGHQEVLRAGRARARASGGRLVVLTFDPPPVAVLAPDRGPRRVVTADEKNRLLIEGGADVVVTAPATIELLALSPEAFVREVVSGRFAPALVVEGPNFHFGKGRSGDVNTLRELAGAAGFEVVEVGPVRLELPGRGEAHVSSTLVRQLIAAGDVESAALCLGRPYALSGRVVTGEQRGRLLEFPTANIEPAGVLVPGDGIYAARAELEGRRCAAAVSIGVKPTFGAAPRAVEVHLLDVSGDFYGKDVTVTFLARLRGQVKFPDADSLRAQIREDIERVRELCR